MSGQAANKNAVASKFIPEVCTTYAGSATEFKSRTGDADSNFWILMIHTQPQTFFSDESSNEVPEPSLRRSLNQSSQTTVLTARLVSEEMMSSSFCRSTI